MLRKGEKCTAYNMSTYTTIMEFRNHHFRLQNTYIQERVHNQVLSALINLI